MKSYTLILSVFVMAMPLTGCNNHQAEIEAANARAKVAEAEAARYKAEAENTKFRQQIAGMGGVPDSTGDATSRLNGLKADAARMDITAFRDAIDAYKLDTGNMPLSLDALMSNPGIPKWYGPYLKEGKGNQSYTLVDPWGQPYVYKAPGGNGRECDVSSAGPDGIPGNADDVRLDF